jgi:bifunctional NMN adenylyltransferase/nudix hydrolase
MTPKTNTPTVGVIIARFQVYDLHEAHHELIAYVRSRHSTVLVLLGCAKTRVTRRNPLDFPTRHRMLSDAYPDVPVLSIADHPSDAAWSRNVDAEIDKATGGKAALLYGSRDSFIPHYHGVHATQEMNESHSVSGKKMRKEVSEKVWAEKYFRMGVIYSAFQRYPTSYQAVDALIWRRGRLDSDGDGPATGPLEVLLGQKPTDSGRWRFIGGMVDPKDDSLEAAVKREACEEAGDINLGDATYLFSHRVDDWRYRKEVDKILTSVMAVEFLWGAPKAGDDISAVRWVTIDKINPERDLMPDHAGMWDKAVAALRDHTGVPT